MEELLKKVDTAVWAWNIKQNTKKGQKCPVNWKEAIQELSEAYHVYLLTSEQKEWVTSSSTTIEVKP